MSTTEPPTVPPQGPPAAERVTRSGAGAVDPVPRLAEGVELIGRFEDSGFKEPPFIARRADGQVVQMPAALYALAEQVDGNRTEAELAEAFGERIERKVEPEMVATLLDEQLRPLGVVAARDGSTPELQKVDPLLALRFRTRVIPDEVVRAITSVFRPLFLPPVVVLVVVAFLGLDVWLFGVHGISQSLRRVIYEPALLFMLIGGVVVATAFHEIGHATGTRYGGARPGVMGVGIYIVWPAFYTDITDAYRLGKGGRLRADLGGMYFNAVFALGVGALYAATGFEPLLLLILLQTFAIIQQSLPLLRLDGYYIVSDLTGVPDILLRMRPILASLLPWREPDPKVTELKAWVRVAVSTYLLILVPVIGLSFLLMLVNAPRAFATGYDSFMLRANRLGADGGLKAVNDVLQMALVVLPALGMVYTGGRVGGRFGGLALAWTAAHPARRWAVGGLAAAAAGFTAFVWWPNGDYRPIQPGERGTLVAGVDALGAVPTGRPSLTARRARQLRGAPFRSTSAEKPGAPRSKEPTSKRSHQRTSTSPATTTPTTTNPPPTTTTTPAPAAPTTTSAAPSATTPTTTAPPPSTTSTVPPGGGTP